MRFDIGDTVRIIVPVEVGTSDKDLYTCAYREQLVGTVEAVRNTTAITHKYIVRFAEFASPLILFGDEITQARQQKGGA